MRIVAFESSLPGTPADARFWAFDADADLDGPTDFVAFGASEEEARQSFIEMLTGQDNRRAA
jgi:hypothetical protein